MKINRTKLIGLYSDIRNLVIGEGFSSEIEWQSKISPENVIEKDFLEEAAWVILSSGFKESILRKKFRNISMSFCDWESADEIIEHESEVLDCALACFNNKRKMKAILQVVRIVHETGFDEFWQKVCSNPIVELVKLPYIGKITVFHLAKNLGFDIAKPDRHLLRISNLLGYEDDVNDLCTDISNEISDSVGVVDVVLWRYATLRTNYSEILEGVFKNDLNFIEPNDQSRMRV